MVAKSDAGSDEVRIPLILALQQAPMLKLLGRIAVSSLLPGRQPEANPAVFEPAAMTIPPPSPQLVASYLAWCGAGARYAQTLPPHLCSQWALSAAARIIGQSRYRLAGIINQGVTLRNNGELPRGEPLQVTARLAGLEEKDGRARLSVEFSNGTASRPDAVVGVLHTTFILSRREKPAASRKGEKAMRWTTVGTWRASANDGFKFALLTGDFNPIHWIGIAGRLSPFGRKVLHGFGMFARSYEVIAARHPIAEIDVRFLKPVPLPSGVLRVQQSAADADGWRQTRLVSGRDVVHIAGRYR
jgi:acyl dehydratase